MFYLWINISSTLYNVARKQSQKSFHGRYRHVVRVRAATGVTQQVIKCWYYDLLFVESTDCLSYMSIMQDHIPSVRCIVFSVIVSIENVTSLLKKDFVNIKY